MITVGIDSYCSIEEIDSIINDQLEDVSFWDSLTLEMKEKFAKKSTKKIDSQYFWYTKYCIDQKLEFPRNFSIQGENGDEIGLVPDKVKECQALECLAWVNYINDSSLRVAKIDAEKGIKSRGVKSANVTYDSDYQKELRENKKKFFSSEAEQLLKPWVQTSFRRM